MVGLDAIRKLCFALCVARNHLFPKDSWVGDGSSRAIWSVLHRKHRAHIRTNVRWDNMYLDTFILEMVGNISYTQLAIKYYCIWHPEHNVKDRHTVKSCCHMKQISASLEQNYHYFLQISVSGGAAPELNLWALSPWLSSTLRKTADIFLEIKHED